MRPHLWKKKKKKQLKATNGKRIFSSLVFRICKESSELNKNTNNPSQNWSRWAWHVMTKVQAAGKSEVRGSLGPTNWTYSDFHLTNKTKRKIVWMALASAIHRATSTQGNILHHLPVTRETETETTQRSHWTPVGMIWGEKPGEC